MIYSIGFVLGLFYWNEEAKNSLDKDKCLDLWRVKWRLNFYYLNFRQITWYVIRTNKTTESWFFYLPIAEALSLRRYNAFSLSSWNLGLKASVQFSRSVFETPWIAARQASLPITNSRSSLRLTSISESVMPSSHLILCHPLLLLPPIPPSIRVFSNESALLMRWPKYWSFSFSIIPSKEIPGLIFRMDWLDLLAVEGTLKSLLQRH